MLGQKQSLLTPRFCRRCGGSLTRTAMGYRCVDCGAIRAAAAASNRDFVIVRPSQRAAAPTLQPVPMALEPHTTMRARIRAVLRFIGNSSALLWRWMALGLRWTGRRVIDGASTSWRITSSAARWANPRARSAVHGSKEWAASQVAGYRESLQDLEERDWQLSRSIPGLGSSVLPLVILLLAIVVALGLGGAIAAALS